MRGPRESDPKQSERRVMTDATMGAQPRVLHLIGNSHIDPLALAVAGGLPEVRATFRSALDPCASTELIFTCDSAAYYEWIEEIDPGMFDEIQSRVAEGRWEIAAAGGSSRIATSPAASRSCATDSSLAGLLPGKIWADRDRRLQRRSVRAQRDAAPDPAQERHGLVRPRCAPDRTR